MLKLPKSIQRKKILWGIAGLGSFAETGFMPALNLLSRARLLSVFSHDDHRAKAFADKFGALHHFDNFAVFQFLHQLIFPWCRHKHIFLYPRVLLHIQF